MLAGPVGWASHRRGRVGSDRFDHEATANSIGDQGDVSRFGSDHGVTPAHSSFNNGYIDDVVVARLAGQDTDVARLFER